MQRGPVFGGGGLARARLSPSALLIAIMSASSTTPFFRPCSSSPAPGSISTRKTIGHVGDHGLGLAGADGLDQHHVVACGFAASAWIRASWRRRRRVCPRTGEGRTKAFGSAASRGMRVLSRKDRTAAARRGRIDREHRDLVAAAGEKGAQRVDGGGLADPGSAGDPDADCLAGRRQQILHQAARRLLVVGPPAFDQGDGARYVARSPARMPRARRRRSGVTSGSVPDINLPQMRTCRGPGGATARSARRILPPVFKTIAALTPTRLPWLPIDDISSPQPATASMYSGR